MNDMLTTSAESYAIEAPPMFPSSVHIGAAHITLNADGTWSGDREAFLAELAVAKQSIDAVTMPILWLIANAIRRE